MGAADGEDVMDGCTFFTGTPLLQINLPFVLVQVKVFPLKTTFTFALAHFAPVEGFFAAFAAGIRLAREITRIRASEVLATFCM